MTKQVNIHNNIQKTNKEDQRTKDTKGNTVFMRKKYSIKGKMDSLKNLRNIASLDGSSYEANDLTNSQKIYSYLKMFSMQCRKNTAVEDNNNIKRMNIQSNLSITTNWGTKFLWSLQAGGRYKEDLCITAKTSNSDIWSLYKGNIIFQLITEDADSFLEKEKINKYLNDIR